MEGKYDEGKFAAYKDNGYIRQQGKNAPDNIVLKQDDGSELQIAVWGPTKGAVPQMPAALTGLHPGSRIKVPVNLSEYKGEMKHNLDLTRGIIVMSQTTLPAGSQPAAATQEKGYWEKKFDLDVKRAEMDENKQTLITRQACMNTSTESHKIYCAANPDAFSTVDGLADSIIKIAKKYEAEVNRQ